MKKRNLWIALLLAALLLPGCGTTGGDKPDPANDLEYIKNKGSLIVGVTEFAPLDYKVRDEWTGFDADMAKLFAKRLGVSAQFREIEWDRKAELLESGEIDVVWNGMTRTEEVEALMSCSASYLSNSQVVVMKSESQAVFKSIEDCDKLLFACEKGSIAKTLLTELKYRYKDYDTQQAALRAVNAQDADAAVVDRNLAAGMTGPGSTYESLTYGIPLNEEEYCVGMRKGSDLCPEVNHFFTESGTNGVLYQTASRYNLEHALVTEAGK
ncbi:MAG: transporter substrate-binding domain-containing protein [Lachnospiraceae bacterium]|nr:transporter substrate-binding domain-containing protein [Lachnospiraceae bacterium]